VLHPPELSTVSDAVNRALPGGSCEEGKTSRPPGPPHPSAIRGPI
jgi:hypothetical protein